MSDGRLELGIGSGYRFDEFRGLNIFPEDSRPMFMEVLEILSQGVDRRTVQPHGKILCGARRNLSQTHALKSLIHRCGSLRSAQDHRMGGEDGLAPDDCNYGSVIGERPRSHA